MKKKLLLWGAPIGLIVGAGLLFLLWMLMEMGKMSPMETQKVMDGLYAIKDGQVNMFLLEYQGKHIAVDAGQNAERVLEAMNHLQIEPEDILSVFLTHSDRDHIGALSGFKNARIFLSAEEEQMINGQTRRNWMMKNCLDAVYETVEDNQEISMPGFTIRCILTPGHTPGAMSYQINRQYLFTGDSMSLKNGEPRLFIKTMNMNSEKQGKSLKRIAGLPEVKYIFTAHYGYTEHLRSAFPENP